MSLFVPIFGWLRLKFKNLVKKHIEAKKNNFFVRDLSNCSFINVSFELRSYERGVAQLGSAGALGAYIFTNETYCNN